MTTGTPISLPANFPFAWDDPAEAEAYWRTDLVHTAYPQVPLVTALRNMLGGFSKARSPVDRDAPRPRQKLVNGYPYREVLPGAALLPPSGIPEGVGVVEYWEKYILPAVEALTGPYKAAPVDRMSLPELVAHLLELPALTEELALLHSRLLYLAREAVTAFKAYCRQAGVTDEEQDDLLHGVENLSLWSSRQQWELGQLMAGDARLLAIVEECRAEEIESRVWALGEPSTALLAGVAAHVSTFGWRAAGMHPLSRIVIEDRTPVWDAVRAAALYDGGDPLVRYAAVAHRREQTAARVRARLAPERREEFEQLYAEALPYVRIFEDHNVFIDQVATALVSRACGEFGRRLAAAGMVDDPRDAYFLDHPELAALDLERPEPALRATLAERRAAWDLWCTYAPPIALGTRPATVDEFSEGFLGRVHEEGGDPRVLTGSPASRGTVTGTARVLRDLREADRLAPGDILVCVTTLPPWTPLFARAGGVVTVGGGTLSHAAITAREFGIPAVLAVSRATERIRDGQRVTVDGTNGIVRLED